MPFQGTIVKSEAKEDGNPYFATIPIEKSSTPKLPDIGANLESHSSLSNLQAEHSGKSITVAKFLAPLPHTNVPLYCVGLNYRSHAKEANLTVPQYAPLWTKPATSLADPDETIAINKFCATSLLEVGRAAQLANLISGRSNRSYPRASGYQSHRNLPRTSAKKEAEPYILGYSLGNDLSCRFFQLPNNSGGQFIFAKAFDKFAPIGPVLVSPEHFKATAAGRRLVTKVNGKVVQDAEIATDVMFNPAQILSQMSQGTTIPAGTAVMTGTPAAVGAFQSPKSFLSNGDEIEVHLSNVGTLRNVVRFEDLGWVPLLALTVLRIALKLST